MIKEKNIGDKVKIINYGSLMWVHKEEWKRMIEAGYATTEKPNNLLQEDDTMFIYDPRTEMIGKIGIIIEKTIVQGRNQYALELEGGNKVAWYFDNQLKLIE